MSSLNMFLHIIICLYVTALYRAYLTSVMISDSFGLTAAQHGIFFANDQKRGPL